jgi:hypothetical protein
MNLEVVLLNDRVHNRDDFECRDEALNDFLKRRANQEHKKNISDTYVLVDNLQPQTILGYFTLSNNGVSFSNLPEQYKKRLPNYPTIGTTLLGRMARDLKTPSGFGTIILKEAMKKSLERGSFFALEVVAKNDELVEYYKSFGFIPLLDDKTHLFLPRATFAKLIE